jgi:hypothetical protein
MKMRKILITFISMLVILTVGIIIGVTVDKYGNRNDDDSIGPVNIDAQVGEKEHKLFEATKLHFAKFAAIEDGRDWKLINKYTVYQLKRDQANFPPRTFNADNSIVSWYNEVASFTISNVKQYDWIEAQAQIQIASYHARVSAWTPAACSVTKASDKIIYESSIQFANPRWHGQLLLPFGGANINNYNGGYYNPHRQTNNTWDYICESDENIVLHFYIALSSIGTNNADFLDIFSKGGQSSIRVLHRRFR